MITQLWTKWNRNNKNERDSDISTDPVIYSSICKYELTETLFFKKATNFISNNRAPSNMQNQTKKLAMEESARKRKNTRMNICHLHKHT